MSTAKAEERPHANVAAARTRLEEGLAHVRILSVGTSESIARRVLQPHDAPKTPHDSCRDRRERVRFSSVSYQYPCQTMGHFNRRASASSRSSSLRAAASLRIRAQRREDAPAAIRKSVMAAARCACRTRAPRHGARFLSTRRAPACPRSPGGDSRSGCVPTPPWSSSRPPFGAILLTR